MTVFWGSHSRQKAPVYNRASLPVEWRTVTDPSYRTAPCARAGHYLIRVHPRGEIVTIRAEVGVTATINS